MSALWLLLKRVPAIAWIEVGLVLFLFSCIGALYVHAEHVGAERERATVLVDKLRRDTIEVVIRDSIVRHDTVHLTRTLARYDTLRETITITDTIAVRRFILAADSTVHACRETVNDLSRACAAKDTVIATQRALLALRVPEPHPVTLKERATTTAIGVAVDEIVRAVFRARRTP